MGRRAHLVGSIPGANATEAMEAALSRLGPYLLTLSDGETGQRAWWIGACIANMGGNPDVELSGGGQHDFSSYDDVPQYRLRDGGTLSAANLEACLPYEQAFTESFPLFRDLRNKYERPDLPFQVGIPGPLDLSVDTFGFEVGFDPRYYQPSFEATASQVNKIAAAGANCPQPCRREPGSACTCAWEISTTSRWSECATSPRRWSSPMKSQLPGQQTGRWSSSTCHSPPRRSRRPSTRPSTRR